MYNPLLLPELREMLQAGDAEGMAEFCNALHPGVTAEVVEGLGDAEIWEVLSHSPVARQVQIFRFLTLARQEELVEATGRERVSALLEEMAPDDRVDLLERIDEEQVESWLPMIAQAERSDIRRLLSCAEDSAGSIMTTEYASLPEDITVAESLRRLRLQAPDRETIYYVYILDEERRLRGFVSLQQLILAKPDALISAIMDRDVISVQVDDDQEDVARELGRYDFLAIPVVDNRNHLVGIVTHDDVIDVLQEEATEDAHLAGAVQPLEDSYLSTPLLTIARKRGIWLVFLFGAAYLMSAFIERYQELSNTFDWMIIFIPLVIATGGNAGSQSATLVIRSLALGEMEPKHWPRLARREFVMGTSLAIGLAVIGFIPAMLLQDTDVAIVVSTTIGIVVILGTMIGALLPLAFKQIGIDPALISNPFVAALVDLTGVVVYYEFARFWFMVARHWFS
jgi:magnesium transporter